MLESLAKTEKQKNLVRATFLLSRYGRPYALPPGVPADRVALMRKAFDDTMNDPKFRSEAKKLKRPVRPTSGPALQKMWKDSLAASPEDKAIVKQIFNPAGK